MWKRWLILILFIIGSGILVGTHGGTAAYLLFYTTLLLPVFSLIYVIYVYFRFRIYQKLEHRTVVKGERIPYTFRLANEDFIPYYNVSVVFLKDHSTVENLHMASNYCLAPNDGISSSTFLTCHYRGEYLAGISHARVTDYLGLFSITYPIQTRIEMTVYPRIVDLASFAYSPVQMDEKDRRLQNHNRQDILDNELRSYLPGDSMKLIHWKASAASGKLLCRNYTEESKNIVCLAADFHAISCKPEEKLVLEDKILEGVLAVVKYLWKGGTRTRLFFSMQEISVVDINTYVDIEAFYAFCCDMRFQASLELDELVRRASSEIPAGSNFMLFTAYLSRKLFDELYLLKGNAVTTTIFYMKHSAGQKSEMEDLFASEFCFVPVTFEDEIVPVLEGREHE
ncbi:MAG: DUF58 domain-containing protein [Lachnospiraceae bacterium]|nr:DUF58 domain-containing protein [Lachnospiraceae bacterium]